MKINERELAVYTLIEITGSGAYNNIVLRKTLNQNNAMNATQKAFITELVNDTLRNLIYIDYCLGQFSKTAVSKMKPLILNTLRVSVYQIYFMDRVPTSAVCNEAVNLVKSKGFGPLSGFVNGVLRNIARAGEMPLPDPKKDFKLYLSIRYSYPLWMIEHFLAEMEVAELEKMLAASTQTPQISIATNTIKTDAVFGLRESHQSR